jgi:hypothetical protein
MEATMPLDGFCLGVALTFLIAGILTGLALGIELPEYTRRCPK